MGDVDLSLLDGFLDPLDSLMPHPGSAPTSQPLLNSSTAPTLDRSSWPGSSALSEAPSASALPTWDSGYGVLHHKDKGKPMSGAAGRPTSFQSLLHHSTPSLESQGSLHKDLSKSMPISGSGRIWNWTPTDLSQQAGAPATQPLFLDAAHLADARGAGAYSHSPGDTSHSLASAAQQSNQDSLQTRKSSGGLLDSPAKGAPKEKSFKELHAERNKQAQRRFRKRQKEKMIELQNKLDKLESEKADLGRRNSMLSSAFQLREEELRKVRERQSAPADAEEDDLARAFQGAVTLTFREDQTITLTPDQIKNMTEQDLAKYWSQYVKELAVLLVAMEGNDQPPREVVERIQALVQRELLFLYIRAALTNMQNVKKFIARAKIEEIRVPLGSTGPNRWREVSEALQLSQEQAAAIVDLWHGFNERLVTLFEQRRETHARMQCTMHAGNKGQEFAQKYLQAHELMDLLKKNLRQEHVLIHEFLTNFYLQKLKPMQMARCFVRSFPWYPDIPAIAWWVAVAAGDADAVQKMQTLRDGVEVESP